MAANRKKGKKAQNTNANKSANGSAAAVTDNAASDNATPAASQSTLSAAAEVFGSQAEGISTADHGVGENLEAEPVALGSVTEAETSIGSKPSSADDENPSTATGIEPSITEQVESTADGATEDLGDVPAKVDLSGFSKSEPAVSPAEIAADSQTVESIATEASLADVKLITAADNSTSTPVPPQGETKAGVAGDFNFAKDEITTLLVPVSPFHRLVACVIVIFTYSILGFMILKTPAGINAQGMHTVDLADAGAYVFIFRGDTQDPYAWGVDGRFRKSLEIEMEPVEPNQRVVKVEPIKDLSGAGFFTVAEFEINQPGTYNVWIKWNDPNSKCKGKIQIEKDPVETFFFKWVLGIVGTIALIYMIGIPMTTKKAQATLPNAVPPVVSNR